jgi:hypothetical protein
VAIASHTTEPTLRAADDADPTPTVDAVTRTTLERMIVGCGAVVAAAVVGAGCTTATDESGAPVTDAGRLDASLYPGELSTICEASATKLAALPSPPDEISRAEWAAEVSRIFGEEAAAFDSIDVGGDVRADHRTLTETTEEQAARWAELSDVLADEADAEAIGAVSDDITALALGRNELVDAMGVPACRSAGTDT